MDFSHYAMRTMPIAKLMTAVFPQKENPAMKPVGLWITPDDSETWNWYDWCAAEQFPCGNLRYRIALKEGHGCCVIEDDVGLGEFTAISLSVRALRADCAGTS